MTNSKSILQKNLTREQYQELSSKEQEEFQKEMDKLSDQIGRELVSNLHKNVLKESRKKK